MAESSARKKRSRSALEAPAAVDGNKPVLRQLDAAKEKMWLVAVSVKMSCKRTNERTNERLFDWKMMRELSNKRFYSQNIHELT